MFRQSATAILLLSALLPLGGCRLLLEGRFWPCQSRRVRNASLCVHGCMPAAWCTSSWQRGTPGLQTRLTAVLLTLLSWCSPPGTHSSFPLVHICCLFPGTVAGADDGEFKSTFTPQDASARVRKPAKRAKYKQRRVPDKAILY